MEIDNRLRDKLWRIEHLYKIVDKKGNSVRFTLNPEQRNLFNHCQQVKATGKNLRLNLLKARQIGFTTFFCIYYLDEVIWHKNRAAAIIAHEREALEKIFRKVRYAWESMPEQLRPKASLDNTRELSFTEANSTIYIALKIRSGTVQHLHVSEKAYIDNPLELKAGSYQAASSGDITNESTANGLNHFYNDWLDGGTVWDNLFFPWQKHPEYVDNTLRTGPMDKELVKLGCTQEQVNWWNYKYEELGKDIVQMKREYPSTDTEAFETANRGVFSNELLEYPDDLPILETIKESNCTVEIYEQPVADQYYRLGADTSGGFTDGDYSSFYIINAQSRNIAMSWHGHIHPDELGHEIETWATKYNMAFAGIEVNNHGLTTIDAIKDTYPELYKTVRTDKVTNETTQILGWNTNSKSKDELIDYGRECLRDKVIPGLPKTLKQELRTFVRREDGKIGAESGCHDDRVMAFLIALMMVKLEPYWQFTKRIREYGPKKQRRKYG